MDYELIEDVERLEELAKAVSNVKGKFASHGFGPVPVKDVIAILSLFVLMGAGCNIQISTTSNNQKDDCIAQCTEEQQDRRIEAFRDCLENSGGGMEGSCRREVEKLIPCMQCPDDNDL